ncbi:hypothetical protein F511_36357 [Dorcoceras hygrometricum]|uniref:Ninja-family protein n=1 Tax=Dorcoceras hygrometricum TaxID=472368 RepID=A0A2Z7CI87_9LAMI|nr:hypothetical protein F511_36357 [Dorcoceras hygrometricum]
MFGLESNILLSLLLPESVPFGWLMGNGGDEKKIIPPETEERYLDKPAEVFSRDLLQSFLGSTSELEAMKEAEQDEEGEEEIGLNLGLSLGGGFGAEPKDLARSSSAASFLPMGIDISDTSPSAVAARGSLVRTSSMPVESEEEKRNRKELQGLRRMEAKRRRSDKRRGVKGGKEMEVDWMGDLNRERNLLAMKDFDIPVGGMGLEASTDLGGGIDVAMGKRKGVSGLGSGGMGSSIESTGKSSSSLRGGLGREKQLPGTKFFLSVGGTTGFEGSSDIVGGIDVATGKGKGVSSWGSGGMQGFGQVVSQGSSSMESTGKSSSSLMGDLEREKHLPVMKSSDFSVGGTGFEASSNPGGGIDVAMGKGKGVSCWGSGGMQGFGHMVSQGSSVESSGGSSSSLTDLESKALQGSSGELSPGSMLSLRERSKLVVGSSQPEAKEDPGKSTGSVVQSSDRSPAHTSRAGGREARTSVVEDMPSVYTVGNGPNGRRVDGILYRYGRGEEVRIMCICHGTFHLPVEFVLHAGGTNVDNPLRHIVIVPNSSPLT